MKTRGLLIVFALTTCISNAQLNKDSLWTIWNDHSQPDTTRILVLKDLIQKGYLFSDPDTAFTMGQTLFDFADSLGFEKWKATALNYQGISCAIRGRYDEAIRRFTYCLQINEELDNKHRVASSLNNIGLIYKDIDEHSAALEYFEKSRKIYEEIDDHYGLGLAYGNAANMQNRLGLHEDAIASSERAQDLSNEVGNLPVVANMYHELAVAYAGLAIKEPPNSARAELQQKALENFAKSLELKRKVGDKEGEANTLLANAEVLRSSGHITEATKLAEEALEISNEMGAITAISEASGLLSDLYRHSQDYDLALEMNELSVLMRDSAQSERNQREILRQEYKYTYEKQALADSLDFAKKEAIKDLEIEKRDADLAKQRIGLLATGGGLLLLILLAVSIRRGKKRSDELLHNILPEEVAKELKENGKVGSKRIEHVTVLFTDFKGFTAMAEQMSAKELVEDLNICFSEFDRIMEKYGIEKIKTIGDAYMAAGGLPLPDEEHAQHVIQAAFEMRDFVEAGKARKIEAGLPYFEIRIGVHTGPVVAGIVGVKKFSYDIWGDTVNTASRMESSGAVGQVNISEATYDLVKDNSEFSFTSRGKVQAKGKGEMEMYFVEGSNTK